MTIYNKEKEMALSRQRDYVNSNGLNGKYDGVCRFELNLGSKEQIREALGITGNTLAEVLNSNRNPIRDFLNDVIAKNDIPTREWNNDWKSYSRYLILQDCDFDLAKVEAKIRQYKNPRSTSIPKMMQTFREQLASLPDAPTGWSKGKILNLLQ